MALRVAGPGNHMRKMFFTDTPGSVGVNSKILMHFDGTNGSTTFTDVYGHTFTVFGSAQLSTAQVKYGTAAALFTPATQDQISTPAAAGDLVAGAQDFTFECWYMTNGTTPNSNTDNGGMLWASVSSTTTSTFQLVVRNPAASGTAATYEVWNGDLNQTFLSGINITGGVWNHVAVVRFGTTTTVYHNGVSGLTDTTAANSNFIKSGDTICIGAQGRTRADGWNFYFPGYIDEARFSKVARYTANFTPSGPFAN